jgi:glycosyltransferase involved in cell wall biosynthesis
MEVSEHQPLISIVMPVYNRQEYVGATIESILAQKYTNWELWVMDDGSDDGTPAIVKKQVAADPRIRYVAHPHIGITGKLKNEGIALSGGDLVCFMDSDDLWPPQKLSRQLEAMRKYPEAGFSFTNGYNFRQTTGIVESYFYNQRQGEYYGDFFKEVCTGETGIRFPTLMVWKHALTAENAFEERRVFSDFSFIANLAEHYKGVAVYELLLQRRIHEGNATSDGWIADYEEHMEAIEKFRKEGKLSASLANSILFKSYMALGATYNEHGRKQEARRAFASGWKYKSLSLAPMKKIIKTYLGS